MKNEVSFQELVSLKDKVYVITRAGSGIGKATAWRLAEAGGRVILADIKKEAIETEVHELTSKGYAADLIVMDVTDITGLESSIHTLVQKYGGIHVWVNIAGIYPGTDTLAMSEKEWDLMLDINLKGSFFAAQKVAKTMIEREIKGVIINTHSTTAERPVPGLVHYVASKTGVDGLTRALAKELGPKGIRVLAVSPTMVKTPGMEAQEQGLSMAFGEDPFAQYAKDLPLQRLATPDEIARVMSFAASDLSSIMTGSIIYADAGDKLL